MHRVTAGRQAMIALPVLMVLPIHAQSDGIRTERVVLECGTTGTPIEGKNAGHDIVDHNVGARAGQRMRTTPSADSTGARFNMVAPSEGEVAFFVGSREGNTFDGVLRDTGNCRLRAYLMRSAARRDRDLFLRSLDLRRTPRPVGGHRPDSGPVAQ